MTTVKTSSTVNTAAAITSLNAQGTNRTPACTQTRATTITLTRSSTAAQSAAIETRMKTRRTGATGQTQEARPAAGCQEEGALALRGAASAQTEGTPTQERSIKVPFLVCAFCAWKRIVTYISVSIKMAAAEVNCLLWRVCF